MRSTLPGEAEGADRPAPAGPSGPAGLGPPPFLTLSAVTKDFGGPRPALDDVTVSFRRGEVHAVVGENGAGKSTLMNVLFGLVQPDAGGILIDGREAVHRAPRDAIAHGIGMVHQHFRLVPRFTVAENIRLAALPERRRSLRRAADIAAFAAAAGLAVDPAAITGDCHSPSSSGGNPQGPRQPRDLLVLDEPTTILTPAEAEALYAGLRRLAAMGTAVAVVTHHLNEVMAHADRVSVIRLGRLISSGPVAGRDRESLIGDIVGRSLNVDAPFLPARPAGPPALVAEGLTVAPRPSSSGLKDFSLTVAAGEVVGIAGVEGNGQRELFEVLTGLSQPDGGHVRLTGGSPKDEREDYGRVDPGRVGAVPEDRHHEGLVMDLSIAANLMLPCIGQPPFSRFGWLRGRAIRAAAARLAESFDVRNNGLSLTPRTLSAATSRRSCWPARWATPRRW